MSRWFFIIIVALSTYQRDLFGEIVGDKTCSTSECHGSLKNFSRLHGPIKSDGCTVCHLRGNASDSMKFGAKAPANHPFLLPIKPKEINESCITCHEDMTGKGFKSIHKAIPDKTCVSCHNPHSGNQKGILKFATLSELCFSCHKETKEKSHGGHQSLLNDKKSCLNCHEAHFSKEDKLLNVKPKTVCLTCHNKEVHKEDGNVIKSIQQQMSTAVSIHKPLTEGKCQECHDPHGSTAPMLLKKVYAQNSPELCFECHKYQLTTATKTQEYTQFRNGSTNLHDFHLNRLKRNMVCQDCHEVHTANQEGLIRSQMDFLNWSLPMQFKKLPDGGTCLSACHKDKRYERSKAFQNEAGR